MSCCNEDLHDEILKLEENINCPFCDEELNDISLERQQCCDEMCVIKDSCEMNVCPSCGSVYGYSNAFEYVDFYRSRHKIRRKSVYHRKYHIQNVLINLRQKHHIDVSYNQPQKIEKVFKEIGKVNDLVYENRKRMISINYILRKLFSLMNKPFDMIPITKSKKTLKIYHEFWNKILSLKGEEINRIIN